MNGRLLRGTIVGLLLATTVACGGSDNTSKQTSGDDTKQNTEPLTLESSRLGVGLRHGEAGYLGERETDRRQQAIDATMSAFDHAFLHLDSFDTPAQKFGSWRIYPPTDANPESSTYFQDNPGEAQLVARTDDLFAETQGAMGKDGFENYSVVVDFWRISGEWYLRWDGNFDRLDGNDPKELYGFFLKDMYDDLLRQIRLVAKEHKPRYIVVGTGMERLLAQSDGKEGLDPSDFSNFKRFFRDVVQEVQRVSPDTKVGAGFNWDRFARQLAPRYGETDPGTAPDREALAEAFRNVLLPFADVGHVLALKSRRSENGDAEYYELLADLEEEFELGDTPVLWYSIGSPVEIASFRDQRIYLDNFLEWNAGVDVAAVAWNSLLDVDGSGGASGKIREQSRCANLIEEFGMETSRCYDGLFEANLSKKETMTFIEEQLASSSQDESSSNGGDASEQ
jgi:hypothetical protein